jgi:hypothetical protein
MSLDATMVGSAQADEHSHEPIIHANEDSILILALGQDSYRL